MALNIFELTLAFRYGAKTKIKKSQRETIIVETEAVSTAAPRKYNQ